MKEQLKRSVMITWDDNYFIVDVMSLGCGERFWVKYCVDKKWEQRNFYSPKRVMSFFRSLRKVGLVPSSAPLKSPYKVPGELVSLLQHS